MKTAACWFLLLFSCHADSAAAWNTPNSHQLPETRRSTVTCAPKRTLQLFSTSRRQALECIFPATILAIIPSTATARNLPLTTNVDESKTGTIETLIPIVRIQQSLLDLQSQLIANSQFSPEQIPLPTRDSIPRDQTSFQRLFDAYSDPVSYKQKFVDQNAFLVYYTRGFDGMGRPNIEDDLPVKQTLQYGARNEAWIAWDELMAEWEFGESSSSSSGEDAKRAVEKAIQALDAYLSLAPTEDLQKAKAMVGR